MFDLHHRPESALVMIKIGSKKIQNSFKTSFLVTLACIFVLILIIAAGCESPDQFSEEIEEEAPVVEEETLLTEEKTEEPERPVAPESPDSKDDGDTADSRPEAKSNQPQDYMERNDLETPEPAGQPDPEFFELPDLELEKAADPDHAGDDVPAGGSPEEPDLPEPPESPEKPDHDTGTTTSADQHQHRDASTLEPPLLAITFDDGNASDFTTAFPLMQEYGIPGTTYITTSLIGKVNHLTWEQVRLLEQAGWTIGCHSHTHPYLSELSREEISEEMEEVDRAFREQGFNPPDHHAYPYGDYDVEVIEVVKRHRSTGRAIPGSVPPKADNHDLYQLEAIQAYLNCEESLYETALQVREAALEETILILYTHDIKDEPSEYGAYPYYFAELLDYINQLDIETVTIDELYEYLKN